MRGREERSACACVCLDGKHEHPFTSTSLTPVTLHLHPFPFFPPAIPTDLVITHALEWPSLTIQWLPVGVQTGQANLFADHCLLSTSPL